MEYHRTVVKNAAGETELIIWQSKNFKPCLEEARKIINESKIDPAQVDILKMNDAGLWESIWEDCEIYPEGWCK